MPDPLRSQIAAQRATRVRAAAAPPDSPTPNQPKPAPAARPADHVEYPRLTFAIQQSSHDGTPIFAEPIVNDQEALTTLVAVRGSDALEEAIDFVHQCDERLAGLIAEVTPQTNADAITPADFLARVVPVQRLRENYRERVGTLAALLNVPAPDLGEAPALEESLAWSADKDRPRVLGEILRLRADLPELDRQIADYATPVLEAEYVRSDAALPDNHFLNQRRSSPISGGQDRLLAGLTPLLQLRRTLRAQLSVAEDAHSQAAAVVGDLVGAAVAAAGGAPTVTAGFLEAAVATGRFGEGDAEAGALAKLGSQLEAAEVAAQRLEDAGASGMLASSAKATLADGRAELKLLKGRIAERQKQHFADQLSQAMEGVESSRRELADLARACPDAFKAGFGQALEGAAWSCARRNLFCKLVAAPKGGKSGA